MVNPYIVVLDVEADAVRALLFDSEARRVEGYSAQLPKRADAAADCLDEMHRLVQADGFRIAAVMGRAESEVTAEDRRCWPAFEGAAWFPSLPEGVATILGCGCASRETFALTIGAVNMLGTVTDGPLGDLTSMQIDEKRWLVSGAVPEAGAVYAAIKQKAKGSVEAYLDKAAADDPLVAALDSAARQVREVYETLVKKLGTPSEVLACGSALLKSPSLSQRIADALGAPLTLSTEPEPAARGASLWALEHIGAIQNMRALPASTGAVFKPILMGTKQ